MNKIERLNAVFNNECPDYTPAGFWFHYPASMTPEEIGDAHVKLYRDIDADIIKVMDDNFGNMLTQNIKIAKASDWREIEVPGKDCEHYTRMERTIRRIAEAAGNEVMIFPTMWSPFKLALFAWMGNGGSDESFMKHCTEDPESVITGVNKIAVAVAEWVQGYMEAGASGLYFTGQFSEPQRFSAEQWEALVKPSDLKVLNRVKELGGRNILHICGEVEHGFKTCPERYRDYPCDLVNWDVHRNDLTLEEGHRLFGKPVLGGMDNHGVLTEGSYEEIAQAAKAVVERYGKQGFMLGADCTVPGDIDIKRLQAAVNAVRE